jgi:hypothetical protein
MRLAGIGREISFNDYQSSRGARGGRQDRNVILETDRPAPPEFVTGEPGSDSSSGPLPLHR